MTRTIAIANQKGGVGKTTTVMNLGVALAQMKHKTLILDMDPQGALSAGLGVNTEGRSHTIYTALLNDDLPVSQVIYPVQAYLDMIPATVDLSAAEIELIPEMRRELTLRRVLEPLQSWYDFILIDCPPSLGLLTVNSLCASQEVLVPVQCEFFAMRGIKPLVDMIDRIKVRLNPNLQIVGILPTMYSTGTIHAREVMDELRAAFGDKVYPLVIHKSIRFAEATVASRAMVEYERRHRGAKAYRDLARLLVGEPISETTPEQPE